MSKKTRAIHLGEIKQAAGENSAKTSRSRANQRYMDEINLEQSADQSRCALYFKCCLGQDAFFLHGDAFRRRRGSAAF